MTVHYPAVDAANLQLFNKLLLSFHSYCKECHEKHPVYCNEDCTANQFGYFMLTLNHELRDLKFTISTLMKYPPLFAAMTYEPGPPSLSESPPTSRMAAYHANETRKSLYHSSGHNPSINLEIIRDSNISDSPGTGASKLISFLANETSRLLDHLSGYDHSINLATIRDGNISEHAKYVLIGNYLLDFLNKAGAWLDSSHFESDVAHFILRNDSFQFPYRISNLIH